MGVRENRFNVFFVMAPPSQGLEPPANPERFKLPILEPLGKQTQPSAVIVQNLQTIGSFATEQEQVTREWIGIQHVRQLRGQTIEAITHADRATCQIDLRAWHTWITMPLSTPLAPVAARAR